LGGRLPPGPLLVALAYVGFVSLGLPDAVLGVAWPSVRDRFGVPTGAAALVFAASAVGYFVSSFFSGRLTRSLGIGLLLAGSTGLVAAAMFGFAAAPLWPLFVAAAVVHGLGSGAIDAGLNGYAAAHLSARHMNWLHACYCFGAMLGPQVMIGVLAADRPYPVGYAAVGAVMAALAVVFLATRPRWGRPNPAGAEHVSLSAAVRHPAVLLQAAVFFLYTGLETTYSQWAFTVLTEGRGVSREAAGAAASVYWASIGVGRVAFGAVAERIGLDRLLRGGLFAAAAGAVVVAAPLPAWATFAGLVVTGLGLAPVYPCLMTRTPQRFGPAVAAHAVGLQVGAAMIGAAAVPAALGLLAGEAGLEAIPVGAVGVAFAVWALHEGLVRRPDA
jgi:fucose permease